MLKTILHPWYKPRVVISANQQMYMLGVNKICSFTNQAPLIWKFWINQMPCLSSILVFWKVTWKTLEVDEDSPCFESPNPQPLHNRISIFVTGIHDRLSNADNSAVGKLWIAAWLLSKAVRYSLYWTNTDIDCRSKSLSSALDILGSLKWVTTKVTWRKG